MNNFLHSIARLLPLLAVALLFACSTTKSIPDGDQLFIGLTKIEYTGGEGGEHFAQTQKEVEAALATAPNGAFFGSSYYRTPFPYRLWVWNWAGDSNGKFKQWMKRVVGKPPVLMSQVNPALRASVAQQVLRNNGYMHATVSYSEVPRRNPKKMKIGYTVNPGPLFTVDSMSYEHFPPQMQQLIDSTSREAYIRAGLPFSVGNLDAERTRLSQLMRNNGYYYYQSGYASYLADTFAVANRVRLRLQLADSLPAEALRPWYIGKTTMQLRRSYREQMTDSVGRSFLKIFYNGKRPPMRPRVILRNMRLRPRSLFSYDNYQESMQKVNATGVFSSVDFRFTPRTSTLNPQLLTPNSSLLTPHSSLLTQDTLDLTLSCVFDQPYDFYVATNFINRTIGRFGPEAKVGLVRRNAFRGGERLDVNVHGAYEWERSGNSNNNSYQYGVDASVEFPRIVLPFLKDRPRRPRVSSAQGADSVRAQGAGGGSPRRRFYATPWTIAKVSSDIVRRPNYYKMHIVAGEWTYRWQPSEQSQHELSPLTVKYQFMNSHTALLDSLLENNIYLAASMSDRFIPKMRYTYIYNSPKSLRHPIRWETTLEESGNVTSLLFMAKGDKWDEKNKKLFKTPYAQFIRVETDLTKTWTLSQRSQLVGHVNAGFMRHFGNSSGLPFSELFYVGGANSVRAFAVRTIGPGGFHVSDWGREYDYLLCNGDMKLVLNLEYRQRIAGNLYGALFLDAGNVWDNTDWLVIENDDMYTAEENQQIAEWNEGRQQTKFRFNRLFRQLATGTGFGLRYDLDFLVIRIDWGFGLHLPYDTGKGGYFNIPRFMDMHALHLAVGYPF